MKIKFGLIGCGNIGKRHAQHIQNHQEGNITGVFDIDIEKGLTLANKYNSKHCKSFDELLNLDVDIVNICTPNGLHAEHAIKCLKAKKHVLVEKPMALSTYDCEQMLHTALENNKQLFVVKQNRYNPPVVALKKLLLEKKLGKIYMVVVNCFWNRNKDYYESSDWKGTLSLDGGTLFTQFSHFVDILYYLFGDVTSVSGKTINANHQRLIEFEDSGVLSFKLSNGAIGSLNYTTSSFKNNMEGSILVFSEKGTIKIGGQYLNTIDYQNVDFNPIEIEDNIGRPNNYGTYQGSMSNHDKVIDNVINTLNGKSSIMTNALDGLKVVSIIEEMYNKIKH
tara:strand:- start:1036 stop:2043 length:1008 start_codon:yes stop_codon:yes gene_type:complete